MAAIENLDLAFWTGFYGDTDDKAIEWASNKAYLDLSRTLKFREKNNNNDKKDKKIDEKRIEWRAKITNVIKDQLTNWENTDNFDNWHKETCKKIIDIDGKSENGMTILADEEHENRLSLGQAQKWLNMTLKYLWLFNRSGTIKPGILKDFITKFESTFHVPLDSYILKYVKKFPKKNRIPKNGLSKDYDININKLKYRWSLIKFENYKEYIDYQTDIREDLNNQKDDIYPLLWELEHWHKATDFYNV